MRCTEMKRIVSVFASVLVLALVICSCAKQPSPQNSENTAAPTQSAELTAAPAESAEPAESAQPFDSAQPAETSEVPTEKSGILVLYFSATGNTKLLAERIARLADADIAEIVPAQPYTAEDLNYHDRSTRASAEQNDSSARPAIAEDVSLDGYSAVFLGYPIWWGQAPRILNTFVEAHDFSGITIIPFCTSGSSDIGSSDDTLAALAGSGNWLQGKRFAMSVSDDELVSWIGDSLEQ